MRRDAVVLDVGVLLVRNVVLAFDDEIRLPQGADPTSPQRDADLLEDVAVAIQRLPCARATSSIVSTGSTASYSTVMCRSAS